MELKNHISDQTAQQLEYLKSELEIRQRTQNREKWLKLYDEQKSRGANVNLEL